MDCNSHSTKKPSIPAETVCAVLCNHYGINVNVETVKELRSFSAKNYVVSAAPHSEKKNGQNFIVKILNSEEALKESLDTKFEIMEELRKKGFECQRVVAAKSGKNCVMLQFATDLSPTFRPISSQGSDVQDYTLCLLEYLEGTELFHLSPWQPEMLQDLGVWLGKLRKSFQAIHVLPGPDESLNSNCTEFDENAGWKVINLPVLRKHYGSLKESHRNIAERVIENFENVVLPIIHQLPIGLIHGDIHDENILLLEGAPVDSSSDDIRKKFGLIDFEDAHVSYSVIDLAYALCYFMIASKCEDNNDILGVSGNILAGHTREVTLTSAEWDVLFALVCGCYVQELLLSEVELQKQTVNEYLKTCFKDGWPQVTRLVNWGADRVMEIWRGFV